MPKKFKVYEFICTNCKCLSFAKVSGDEEVLDICSKCLSRELREADKDSRVEKLTVTPGMLLCCECKQWKYESGGNGEVGGFVCADCMRNGKCKYLVTCTYCGYGFVVSEVTQDGTLPDKCGQCDGAEEKVFILGYHQSTRLQQGQRSVVTRCSVCNRKAETRVDSQLDGRRVVCVSCYKGELVC